MRQPASLAFLALAVIFILVPLSVVRPGLPLAPRGDEATYLRMADSLATDGDLRVDRGDLLRHFEVFPYADPELAMRSTTDGLVYDAPALYAAASAPFVRWFGSVGPLGLNALLLITMLLCGRRYLRRWDDDGMALLATCVFVLASPLLAYTFWMHPALLTCAAIFTGLYAVAPRAEGVPAISVGRCTLASASISVGAVAAGHPHLLWLLAPVLVTAWRRSSPQHGPVSLISRVTAMGAVLAGVTLVWIIATRLDPAFTPNAAAPDTTLEVPFRATIEQPLVLPEVPVAEDDPAIIRGDTTPAIPFVTTLGYFIAGRHVGFLPYFPVALIVLLLMVRGGRPGPFRWALLTGCAMAFVVAVFNHAGADGDGAVARLLRAPANSALAPLYAALFFLIRRWRPSGSIVVGAAAAAISLGTLLVTPLGMPVSGASGQSHARARPLALWPLETAWLAHLEDYDTFDTVVGSVWRRIDETYAHHDALGVLGGIETRLWLDTAQPLDNLNVIVRDFAPNNTVTVRLGDARTTIDFADTPAQGQTERLRLTPSPSSATALGDGSVRYPLTIETRVGARPAWRQASRRNDYLGAELSVLGPDDHLNRDVFGIAWEGCGAPTQVEAEERFKALVRPRNTSPNAWPHAGPARVRLGYRWRASDGTTTEAGLRTDLDTPTPPQTTVVTWLKALAPVEPGTYTLEADAVFETVAWFSLRDQPTCLMEVEVVEPVEPLTTEADPG